MGIAAAFGESALPSPLVGEGQARSARERGQRAYTGRCARTAITTPSPASSDTADVPP